MNCFDGIIEDLNIGDFDFIEKNLKPLDDLNKTFAQYLERVNNVIKEYQKTKVVPDLSCIEHLEQKDETDGGNVEDKTSGKNSLKENIKQETFVSPPQTIRRSRRNALKENVQNTDKTTRSIQTKKTETHIKCEKSSTVSRRVENKNTEESINSTNDEVSSDLIKTEMPAPTKRAPRKKKKKESEVQVKQEKIERIVKKEANTIRDSDVILEEVDVSVINLVESSDEDETTATRPERTSLKKKQTKRSRTSSSSENDGDANKDDKKKSKSNEATITNKTRYEDAISTTAEPTGSTADATFVTRGSQKETQNPMNATVVIEHSKLIKNLVPQSVEDMMTDDESTEEMKKKNRSPPKPARAIPKPIKPIFSLFAQSPVKQKVKAFEKLQEQANAATVSRVTRTKTRAFAKEREQEALEREKEVNCDAKNIEKEKNKLVTPVTSKFIPKAASTNIKSSRHHNLSSSSNESVLSAKTTSALKASQAEYRERERKRKEKEIEAVKKKEALIQAQIEEKKRKREEKQLKAQQQRELLEKDKMKAVEAQRLKEERHRRLIAEQEEKKQRAKEEIEKKRMMAKLRAIEEKKREEEKRLEEHNKQEAIAAKLAKQDDAMVKMLHKKIQKTTPLYMKSRAPLLPTGDCYDSDDEEAKNHEYVLPQWNKESKLKLIQKCVFAAGEALKNTFFSIQAQTPDLQDIFEVIEPQKLKRTSSAVWHKPPRFTMIPGLDSHDETEEFDEAFE